VWQTTPLNGLPELVDLVGGFDWGVNAGVPTQWGDQQIVTWANDFLGRAHTAPFFLTLGFTMPHLPWWVPQTNWDRFPAEPALPPYLADDRADTPPYAINHIDTEVHRIITEAGKWHEAVHAYLAAINYVDDQVGRLLVALDQSAYASNTIVVFFSDHGFQMGEKNAWTKATLWEESTRVPFIIVAPGVAPAGGVAIKAVSLLDLYPTLVELAGFSPRQQLDGVSLAGLVQDPVNGARARDFAVTSYYFGDTLRNERWRYTHYTPFNPAEGGEELYDHDNDPDEHVNLAASPEHAALKATLAAQLTQALTFEPSVLPSLEITAPSDGSQVSGHGVALVAAATDAEDGDLSGAVQWTSDLDGPISSPAELSVGQHLLTATVTDSSAQSVSRQVHVRVRQARDDYIETDAASPVLINVLANDVGFSDPVAVSLASPPLIGSASVQGSPGTQTGIQVQFSPPPGFTGSTSFSYSVDDGTNADTASVQVVVRPLADLDGDGIADAADNCIAVANADQRDTSGDGYGNLCDADLDDSGTVNFADLALFRAAFGSANANADFDGNGVVNFADLAVFRRLFGAAPGPSGRVPPEG